MGGCTGGCIVPKLYAQLGKYEDTGLMPEEITAGKPACVFYCNRQCNLNGDFCIEGPGCPWELDADTAMRRLTPPPNAPLTLDELRKMDGEPVWVVQINRELRPFWMLIDVEDESAACRLYCAMFEDYGTEWLAYHRRPEEQA